MKKLLLIILLIAGCGTEPQDEIKEVDWLMETIEVNIFVGLPQNLPILLWTNIIPSE